MSEAEKALRNILDYIGGLPENLKKDAQLISYIEWAIRNSGGRT